MANRTSRSQDWAAVGPPEVRANVSILIETTICRGDRSFSCSHANPLKYLDRINLIFFQNRELLNHLMYEDTAMPCPYGYRTCRDTALPCPAMY